MTADPEQVGRFDVVFFLGVLYHLRDPLRSLRRLRELTGELAIVETSIMAVPGYEVAALWRFLERGELDGDPTNWWQPNLAGLEAALCGGRVLAHGGGRRAAAAGPGRGRRAPAVPGRRARVRLAAQVQRARTQATAWAAGVSAP